MALEVTSNVDGENIAHRTNGRTFMLQVRSKCGWKVRQVYFNLASRVSYFK